MRACWPARRHSRREFTLVEGIVATVIIAVILVGAAPFFYYARSVIHRSRLHRQAVEEATEHLEELLKLAYDDIAPGMPPHQVQLDGVTAAITTQVQTEATDPSSGYSYKRVTVEISWTFNDQAAEERFVTFISGRSEAP